MGRLYPADMDLITQIELNRMLSSSRGLMVRPQAVSRPSRLVIVSAASEEARLRLHNLGPDVGSRHKENRKGRGISAGQVRMRSLLYLLRRLKHALSHRPREALVDTVVRDKRLALALVFALDLREAKHPSTDASPSSEVLQEVRMDDIASNWVYRLTWGFSSGMGAGLPDFVVVNLTDLEKNFAVGAEISLDTIKEQVLSVSGRDTSLPLKILGTGSLSKALTVRAASFSESAKAAIEAAGGKAELVEVKKKWNRWRDAAARKANPEFAAERKKVKVAKLVAKGRVNKKTKKAKVAA